MRALVIGHDHVAGLEHLGDGLVARGYELERLWVVPEERFDEPDVAVEFPAADGWDLVVTLGAPWPRPRIAGWAATEIDFLHRARDAGSAILGVCFGGQLLAEALGADVVPLQEPRIGWAPIAPRVPDLPIGPWFQWHSEQLTAPPGAEVLAESDDGVEAFQVGRCVGVQFHPEMTPRLLERWLALPGGSPTGLDLPALHAATREHAPGAARATGALLDRLVRPAP